ncbi:MAG TPA: hypothetical protein VGL02_13700, partial [Streptomyces sp.]
MLAHKAVGAVQAQMTSLPGEDLAAWLVARLETADVHGPQLPKARRGIVVIDGTQDVPPVLARSQHPGDQC